MRTKIMFMLVLSFLIAPAVVAQERVLHFPPDRSLGKLTILNELNEETPWAQKAFELWRRGSYAREFGEAQGDVRVPANARLGLCVSEENYANLAALSALAPGDIERLGIEGPRHPNRGQGRGGDSYDTATGLDSKNVLPSADDCLREISQLSGLKVLSIDCAGTTAVGLGLLAKMTSLESLSIRERLDEAGATQIAQIKSLRSLSLDDLTQISLEVCQKFDTTGRPYPFQTMPISSEILSRLAELPSLEMLSIRYIQPDAFACLAKFASLRKLTLAMGGSANGMQQCPPMPSLSYLEIYDLMDEELATLPAMPSLKTLHIKGDGYTYTGSGMARLSQLTSLETLWICGYYSDSAIAAIQPLPNLKQVVLTMPFHGGGSDLISDATLVHLSNFPSLESLQMTAANFNAEGLKSLAKLTNLKDLWAPNNRALDDNGMAELGKCSHLVSLNLRACKITDTGLAQLEGLSQLKTLTLFCRFDSPITNKAIARLREKIPGLVVEED